MSLLPFERAARELLVRREAKSSERFGLAPEKRQITQLLESGIINVDKPKGPTSHQVSAYVRDILGVEKSGHSGTLDPKVTGCLPVAYGKATKVVQALLPAGKEYVCIMHLHAPVEEAKLRQVMGTFIGKIKQLPPIKSAVKRQWRMRSIYYIDIIEIEPQDVLFKVGCEAGTYIRKLCHDIGQELGVGAHMGELRRTKAGPFNDSKAHSLYDIKDALSFYKDDGKEDLLKEILLPVEKAVEHLGKVYALDSSINAICHGSDLKVPGVSKIESGVEVGEMVAVMTLKGELVALGTLRMPAIEVLSAERGIVVKIEKVFMEPGVYPKMEKAE